METNPIIDREQTEFEESGIVRSLHLKQKKYLKSFLSASNKRVALAVLGSVMKSLPKEDIPEENPYFKFAKLLDDGKAMQDVARGFNSALSAAKKIITDEKGRWV